MHASCWKKAHLCLLSWKVCTTLILKNWLCCLDSYNPSLLNEWDSSQGVPPDLVPPEHLQGCKLELSLSWWKKRNHWYSGLKTLKSGVQISALHFSLQCVPSWTLLGQHWATVEANAETSGPLCYTGGETVLESFHLPGSNYATHPFKLNMNESQGVIKVSQKETAVNSTEVTHPVFTVGINPMLLPHMHTSPAQHSWPRITLGDSWWQ